MTIRRTLLTVLCTIAYLLAPRCAGPARLHAQSAVRRPTATTRPAITPASGDTLFEFLLGEWRVDASPRVSRLAALVHGVPRYTGVWRGRRTAEGLVDELRLNDAGGTMRVLLRFERRYDPATRTWRIREIDRDGSVRVGRPPVSTSGTITLPSADGTFRSRFVERTPTRFRYVREFSADGGRTWSEPVMTVIATRTAVLPQVSP